MALTVIRWFGLVYIKAVVNYGSTAIWSPFNSNSTAIRPRYDHSTTCITIIYGPPVWAAAMKP